jgi:hypothetical protein
MGAIYFPGAFILAAIMYSALYLPSLIVVIIIINLSIKFLRTKFGFPEIIGKQKFWKIIKLSTSYYALNFVLLAVIDIGIWKLGESINAWNVIILEVAILFSCPTIIVISILLYTRKDLVKFYRFFFPKKIN